MPDYQKMYTILFNQLTDTIEQLQQAQKDTEEIFIQMEDTPMLIRMDKKRSQSEGESDWLSKN